MTMAMRLFLQQCQHGKKEGAREDKREGEDCRRPMAPRLAKGREGEGEDEELAARLLCLWI